MVSYIAEAKYKTTIKITLHITALHIILLHLYSSKWQKKQFVAWKTLSEYINT